MDCKLCIVMYYKFTVHKLVQNYISKVPTSCKSTKNDEHLLQKEEYFYSGGPVDNFMV